MGAAAPGATLTADLVPTWQTEPFGIGDYSASKSSPVVAEGRVFAGFDDGYLRAFDVRNGRELWKDELPGGTQTTPMTYQAGGRQFVVMVTGHHLWFGTPASDAVVAYSLPPNP